MSKLSSDGAGSEDSEILRLVVDHLPDAVLVIDSAGALRFSNRCADVLFAGVTVESVLSRLRHVDRDATSEFSILGEGRERTLEARCHAIPWRTGTATLAIVRDVTSQRETPRTVLHGEHWLRLLAETVEDVFWVSTPGVTQSLYVSRAYEKIWGRPRTEFDTNPLALLSGVHPDDRERVRSYVDEAHASRRDYTVQYRVVRPDGDVRWILERGFGACDPVSLRPVMVGVCTDITEQVLAEAARDRNAEVLADSELLAGVGAWEWDLERAEVATSQEWCRIHGSDRRQLDLAEFTNTVHPDDRARLAQQQRALTAGECQQYTIDYRILRKDDGQVRYVTSHGKSRVDGDGRIRRVIGCDQDVTARAVAELALRSSREYIQKLYGAVGEGIFAVRMPERLIEHANPMVEGIFGYASDELLGHSTAVLYCDAAEYAAFGLKLERALLDGRTRVKTEQMLRRKSGQLFRGQITTTFVHEHGELTRVISVVQDVTQRHQAEQMSAALLHAAHAALESQNFAKATEKVLTRCRTQTGAEVAYLVLRQESGSCRVVLQDGTKPVGAETECFESPCEVALTSAHHAREPLATNAAPPCFETDPILASRVECKNRLSVTLLLDGEPAGVVVLANKPGGFDEADAELVRAIGEIVTLSAQRERYLQQLLNAEQLLTATGRMARVGGWEVDLRARKLFWTTVTRELHEVQADFAPSLEQGLEFFHPDDRSRLRAAVEDALTLGKPFDLEVRFTTAKGNNLWAHTRCEPVPEEGNNLRLIGAFQDITSRKVAEEAITERERLLALITDNMFDMVSLADREEHFTFASPSYKQLGINPAQLVGRSVQEFFPEELVHVQGENQQGRLSATPPKLEYPYRCPDGRLAWLESVAQVLQNEVGERVGTLYSTRDVTDLKHYQQSLRAEKDRAQRYLDIAAVMLIGLDAMARINLVNRRGCQVLGVGEPSDVLGQDYFRFIPTEERDRITQVFRALMAGDVENYQRVEGVLVSAAGESRRILWSNAVVRDEAGRVVGVLASGEDVTELATVQAQLAKADRLSTLGMLAAGVAHEINNPLAYVLSNLESLTEDLPHMVSAIRQFQLQLDERVELKQWEENVRGALEMLNPGVLDDILERVKDALGGTRRIREIARGLSTFSRVDEGELVPVNVMHAIELAINMTYNEFKHRARIVKDYGRTPTVLAHEGRLSQVFINLLINAAHAIQEGDVENNSIRVRTWTDGSDVFAEVRDTGSGIAPEHLARLFEPFFTTKKIGVGSGLGLPISKNIVEGYGGTLSVTSELGKGTRITVQLPQRTKAVGATSCVVSPPSRIPRARGRILVIDDEESIRMALSRLLRGHEVVLAAGGAEGIAILEQDSGFDLVLCDVMMPDVTGIDLHQRLIAMHPQLNGNFVFMTGGAFTPRTREYLRQVSAPSIEKPFESSSLYQLLSERIRR